MQSTFVTAGLQFGFSLYLMFQYKYQARIFVDAYQQRDLDNLVRPIVAGPLLMAVVAAAITAALLFILKRTARAEQFRQTSLLLVASGCSALSSVPYLLEECMYILDNVQ